MRIFKCDLCGNEVERESDLHRLIFKASGLDISTMKWDQPIWSDCVAECCRPCFKQTKEAVRRLFCVLEKPGGSE
jgi:hypothetical protein